MDQDISKPEREPKRTAQGFSPFGCFLSAAGVTLMTLSLLGAAMAASVWALVKLIGLPDSFLYGGLLIGAAPVIAASLWMMGRAWHVERRLAEGLDVDSPVFRLMHYVKKT
jgi:hypothetical protein